MPIITFDSLDLVPDGLKDFAKTDETTNKITVNVVANAKLDEFRERNVEQAKRLETLEPAYTRLKAIVGDNPEAFETDLSGMRDIAQRVKDGELKTDDQIEKAVQDRVKQVKEGFEETNKGLRTEAKNYRERAEALQTSLDRTRIDKDITAAVIVPESGVRAEALPDVLERAYRAFKVEDGKVVRKNGDSVVYGANGADPMTASEWLVKLRDEAPHYFKGNSGGGSGGGSGEKVAGFSSRQIAEMSPAQKLALANANGLGRR